MSEREDRTLGELLRDAPPERDALFRLGVIERRERQRFRRRSIVLLVASVSLLGVFWLGWRAGVDLIATAALAALGAALIGACLLSAPGVLEVMRRLRNDRGDAR
jgi:hypothetical protein